MEAANFLFNIFGMLDMGSQNGPQKQTAGGIRQETDLKCYRPPWLISSNIRIGLMPYVIYPLVN